MNARSHSMPTLSELVTKLTLFGGSNGLAQVMLAVYTILIARILGREGYGIFISSYSIVTLSSFLVNWGMDVWLFREASHQNAASQLLPNVLRLKTCFGAGWSILVVLLPILLFPNQFTFSLLLLCVIDVWVESITNTFLAFSNAQKKLRQSSTVILVSRVLRLGGAIGLVLIGMDHPLAYAMGRALANIVSLLFVLRLMKPSLAVMGDKETLVSTWRQSVPYSFSELLVLIYSQADVTLLALLAGKSAAGVYSPAVSLINALFVIPNAVYLTFLPHTVDSLSSNCNLDEKRKLLGWSLAVQASIGVGLALIVGTLGKPALDFLLQKDYSMTGRILTVLSPILLLKAINFGFVTWIVAIGWQKRRILPQALVAFGGILANLLVIPSHGPLGAAWVYLAGEGVLAFGYGLVAWRGWQKIMAETL
ncbi:MAG TPA: oligosaccharide flippase family protein [Anaerolineaceae bacterium]|jgi:O-antigen/teichoic acid export membrane protein|nr:oligosaccharide flippase family protein [Anaerolineaceae bacterium]HOH20986.1 oligosaccharide flippase family protein [Anaerolineaceae bacterium]HQO98572.1 oligosaccharide flippase family protein [Anaerolineaceae bacterium]